MPKRALAEQLDLPEYLVPLILGQVGFHFVRAEHRRALTLCREIEQIGETRDDSATQLLGHMMHGMTRFELGELVAARELLERSLDLADPGHRTAGGLSLDPYAMALTNLALTLACLGYVDQARSRMAEALSEARRLAHSHTLAYQLVHKTWLDWLLSSPMAHLEECRILTTEQDFPYYLGWAEAYRGRSLLALETARESLALLTSTLADFRATGAIVNTPMPLTWLAEAYSMLGQSMEEKNCLIEVAQIVETSDERVFEAELLHRVPGDLLDAAGDRSGAERHYRQAIAIAERQSAKLFQLRASTSLARLWRDQGRRTEARDLLVPIYGWFTEGFDTPDLKEAKALLDELA